MAGISQEVVVVTNAATVLTPLTNGGMAAHIKNLSPTETIWVGGSGITPGNGFPLEPGERLELIFVPASERVRAIRGGSVNANVAVIRFEF